MRLFSLRRIHAAALATALLLSGSCLLTLDSATAAVPAHASAKSKILSHKGFSINGLNTQWAFETRSGIKCRISMADPKRKAIDMECAVDSVSWRNRAKSCSKAKHIGVFAQNYNDLQSSLMCSDKPLIVDPPHPPGWSDGFRVLERGQRAEFFGYICGVTGKGDNERVACTYKKAHSIDFTIGHKVLKVYAIY